MQIKILLIFHFLEWFSGCFDGTIHDQHVPQHKQQTASCDKHKNIQ